MLPLGALGEAIGTRTLLIVAALAPLLGMVSCFRLPRDAGLSPAR